MSVSLINSLTNREVIKPSFETLPVSVLCHLFSFVGPQDIQSCALVSKSLSQRTIKAEKANQIKKLQTFIDTVIQALSNIVERTGDLDLIIKKLQEIRHYAYPSCKGLKSLKEDYIFHVKDQIIDALKDLDLEQLGLSPLHPIDTIAPPHFCKDFWEEVRALIDITSGIRFFIIESLKKDVYSDDFFRSNIASVHVGQIRGSVFRLIKLGKFDKVINMIQASFNLGMDEDSYNKRLYMSAAISSRISKSLASYNYLDRAIAMIKVLPVLNDWQYTKEIVDAVAYILKDMADQNKYEEGVEFIENLGELRRFVFEHISNQDMIEALKCICKGLVKQENFDGAIKIGKIFINSWYVGNINNNIMNYLKSDMEYNIQPAIDSISQFLNLYPPRIWNKVAAYRMIYEVLAEQGEYNKAIKVVRNIWQDSKNAQQAIGYILKILVDRKEYDKAVECIEDLKTSKHPTVKAALNQEEIKLLMEDISKGLANQGKFDTLIKMAYRHKEVILAITLIAGIALACFKFKIIFENISGE